MDVEEGDDIEFVAICDGLYSVERIKVSKTVNIDYSGCTEDEDDITVQFVTSSDYELIGLTTNKDNHDFQYIDGIGYLSFKKGTDFNSISLLATLKEKAFKSKFYIINYPVTVIDPDVQLLVVNPLTDKAWFHFGNSFKDFTNEYDKTLILGNGYEVKISKDGYHPTISGQAGNLDIVGYKHRWSFGTSSSFINMSSDQIWESDEAPILISEVPDEIILSDSSISQDGTEISFTDKPILIEGMSSSFFSFDMSNGSDAFTYIIDSAYLEESKKFEVVNFSTLPGIDSSFIPSSTVSSIDSIESVYMSTSYPDNGSFKLTIGSK